MFEIGAKEGEWPGLSKLVEECGEVMQVVGKIIATRGSSKHWDGKLPLDERLLEELADLQAAIDFVLIKNFSAQQVINFATRMREKLDRFKRWHVDEGKQIFERLEAPGGPISDVNPRTLSCGCSALDHNDEDIRALYDSPERLEERLRSGPVCSLGWPKAKL